MALILAHKTNRPADALTLYSLLKSGGFHPELFNFHHGFIALGYVNALDGFRIILPENEIIAARKFLKSTKPILDYDPIRPKRFHDIVYASVLTFNPFWVILLLPPSILLLIALIFMALERVIVGTQVTFLLLKYSLVFCVIAILAHAKYVALPKLRKTRT